MIKINKNLNIVSKIFDLFCIVLISILLYLALPIKTTEVVFIPKGSVSKIISHLNKNNYKMGTIDKYSLVFIGSPQSGWINVGVNELSRGDFLYKLTTAKAAMVQIQLIPGETTEYFFSIVAQKLNLNSDLLYKYFLQNSHYKEGALIPETYNIPLGITEELLVKFLLDYSDEKYSQMSNKIFKDYNHKKWYDYLIKASIIQKEAASKDEMPIVSGVIQNRLKKGMKLQMDGALNYGMYSHVKITPERIKTDNTKYNTYKYDGLPDDAVCNVSSDAIFAAIYPKKTNYLYFMRDKKTGLHKFNATLKEHELEIDRQRKIK